MPTAKQTEWEFTPNRGKPFKMTSEEDEIPIDKMRANIRYKVRRKKAGGKWEDYGVVKLPAEGTL
jgi:hypothetical protein